MPRPRGRRALFVLFTGAFAARGRRMPAGSWRAARVEAPALERVFAGEAAGFVEEVDFRKEGARFLLRVSEAAGLSPRADALSRSPDLAGRPPACGRGLLVC